MSRLSDGPRAVRTAIDREHTARAHPRAKTVKLADVIDNVEGVLHGPRDFAIVYVREKRALMGVLHEGHPVLWRRADAAIRRAYETLGLAPSAA